MPRSRDIAAAAGGWDVTDLLAEERLRELGAVVELHVEQGRALADIGAPVASRRRSWRTGGGG